MGRFLNPDNSAFQVALNSEIYVDKTGLLEKEETAGENTGSTSSRNGDKAGVYLQQPSETVWKIHYG